MLEANGGPTQYMYMSVPNEVHVYNIYYLQYVHL